MTDIAIARESPGQVDVARLIEELDVYQAALYPAESNHLLALDALSTPDVRFFVARRDGARSAAARSGSTPKATARSSACSCCRGRAGCRSGAGCSSASRPRRAARA